LTATLNDEDEALVAAALAEKNIPLQAVDPLKRLSVPRKLARR